MSSTTKNSFAAFVVRRLDPHLHGGDETVRVENANGRLRRFLPLKAKGKEISQRELEMIAAPCNNTPRKCLGYKTPAEVNQNQLLHFKCEFTSRSSSG